MKSNNKNLKACLDIGNNTIKMALFDDNYMEKLNVLAFATVFNKSIKNGKMIDFNSFIEQIYELNDEIERQAGIDIEQVRISMLDDSIESHLCIDKIQILNNEVSVNDISQLYTKVRNTELNKEIIHIMSGFYEIDNNKNIKNPLNFSTNSLALNNYKIFMNKSEIQNKIKAINNAGIKVSKIIFDGLASAEGALDIDDKEFGCCNINIGHSFTTYTIYVDNKLVLSKVINIGSNNITKDLSIGLRLIQTEAEKIKKEKGLQLNANKSDYIMYQSIDGIKKIFIDEINTIIQERLLDIYSLIKNEIDKNKFSLSRGLIMSGGNALMLGICGFTQQYFNVPVRLAVPKNLQGLNSQLLTSDMITLIGLSSKFFEENDLSYLNYVEKEKENNNKKYFSSLFNKLRKFNFSNT